MIISHKHKFIFIKTRKTASTSIEIALSAICGPSDILTPLAPKDEVLRAQLTGKTAQNYLVPWNQYRLLDFMRLLKNRKRVVYFNHITARVLKQYLGQKTWNDYYVFCFERNPLDKCLSHFRWRGKKQHYSDFKAYLESKDYQLIQGERFYKDKRGALLVDMVYKMEQMPEAFSHLQQQLNVLDTDLNAPDVITKKSEELGPEANNSIVKRYLEDLLRIFASEFDVYS